MRKNYLGIKESNGSNWRCSECESNEVAYVVHNNFKRSKDGEFGKICDETFLCENCWTYNWYMNTLRYGTDGQADFTSLPIREYRKRTYEQVPE